jgi:hypothetical protein
LTAYAGYSEAYRCAGSAQPSSKGALYFSSQYFVGDESNQAAKLPGNGSAPFTDPRSVSPGRPRALYAGMKV